MDPLSLGLMGLGLGGSVANIIFGNRAAEREHDYEIAQQRQKLQEDRRNNLKQAIGIRSNYGVDNPIPIPNTNTDRTLGALGSVGGNLAANALGYIAGQSQTPSDLSSPLVDDPNDAIMRRIQAMQDPNNMNLGQSNAYLS